MYEQLKDEKEDLFGSWKINILIVHMISVIKGSGTLVNEKGKETPLKAGDKALVNPEGLMSVIPMKSTSSGTREMFPSK